MRATAKRGMLGIVLLTQLAAQEPTAIVGRREAELQAHPEDTELRGKLIRQYFIASRQNPAAERARVAHVLWLVNNRPEADVPGEPFVTISRSGADFEAVRDAWAAQIAKPSVRAQVLANAANFFRPVDPDRAIQLAQRARATEPKNDRWAQTLGDLYMFRIVGITSLNENGFPNGVDRGRMDSQASKDLQAMLLASRDASLIGAVAAGLLQRGAIAAAETRRQEQVSQLAEALAQRGRTIEPAEPRWHAILAQLYSQRMELASGEARTNWARKALGEFEASNGGSPELAGLRYPRIALEAGELAKAGGAAERCLASSHDPAAVHECHVVLGRIAVRRDDMKSAGDHLLAAAGAGEAPTLSSFGPNMMLARELLLKGERAVVLEYFRRCTAFWTMGGQKLEQWTADVKAGRMPQFGANLNY